jgi:hypothetical protein
MTKDEWAKLMDRCATHNDFFKPRDLQRNAIWYSKLPKTLTFERAVVIVDNYYANNKGNIGLFAFHEALAAERQEQTAKERIAETTRLVQGREGDWPTITDETRAMIQTITNRGRRATNL